jgi:zinc transporter ZupT
MLRQTLAKRNIAVIILILQIIPLVIFPPDSYSPTNQEWWLPVILGVLAVVSVIQLLTGKNNPIWPWLLMGFSQGFNIISRILMFFPHITHNVNGTQEFYTAYVVIGTVAMALSLFMLWYTELPEVRMTLVRD